MTIALAMEQERRWAMVEQAYSAMLFGINNRPENSPGRLVDQTLDIAACTQVGVAATKSFLGQLLAFYAPV